MKKIQYIISEISCFIKGFQNRAMNGREIRHKKNGGDASALVDILVSEDYSFLLYMVSIYSNSFTTVAL